MHFQVNQKEFSIAACIRARGWFREGVHQKVLPPLSQEVFIVSHPPSRIPHPVNVVNVQQQAHAVLNDNASCQLGFLLQGFGLTLLVWIFFL